MQTPVAVQRMIEATNAGNREAFVNAFTDDAYLEDWGRVFRGRAGVAEWNESDNIGRNAHFEATGTVEQDGRYIVTLVVTGDGFNGTSNIVFEVQDQQVRSMIISAE
jgi:hypothetical protein